MAALPVDVPRSARALREPAAGGAPLNSRRSGNRCTFQRCRSHPLAARSVGLSRAPAPSSISQLTSVTRLGRIAEYGGNVKLKSRKSSPGGRAQRLRDLPGADGRRIALFAFDRRLRTLRVHR